MRSPISSAESLSAIFDFPKPPARPAALGCQRASCPLALSDVAPGSRFSLFDRVGGLACGAAWLTAWRVTDICTASCARRRAQQAAAIPGPIRALHDAVAQLPDSARDDLDKYAEACATWAALGGQPQQRQDPDEPRAVDPGTIPLQGQLSRPSHDAFHATFVSSTSDPVILFDSDCSLLPHGTRTLLMTSARAPLTS